MGKPEERTTGQPKQPTRDVTPTYDPENAPAGRADNADILAKIFTPEKITANHKIIDEATRSFFDLAHHDMIIIRVFTANKIAIGTHADLYQQIFQPLCNIKGHAEIFGFSLIACICKYLIDYCEQGTPHSQIPAKDMFIISKLLEALERTFREKIIGSGGDIEQELVAIIDLIRQ